MSLTFQKIQTAAVWLRGKVLLTPRNYARTLSQITGAEVYLKFEILQFTAALSLFPM